MISCVAKGRGFKSLLQYFLFLYFAILFKNLVKFVMKNIFPLPAEKIAENITESNVAIELQTKGISPVYKKNKIKIIIIYIYIFILIK